jgi:hypothetical protein
MQYAIANLIETSADQEKDRDYPRPKPTASVKIRPTDSLSVLVNLYTQDETGDHCISLMNQ